MKKRFASKPTHAAAANIYLMPPMPEHKSNEHQHRIMLFAMLSRAITTFDFVLYLFMADIMIANFFSHHESSSIISQIEIIGLFAVGYLSRPIGAILLGQYADIKGRKSALFLSILLITISTLFIACLPTYAMVGIIAPILLLMSRILQGMAFSVYAPLTWTFVAEHLPTRQISINCSYITASFIAGVLFSMLFFMILIGSMSQASLYTYGWRIAFVIAALLNLIILWLWRYLSETPTFLQYQQILSIEKITPTLPIKRLFKNRYNDIFLAIILSSIISSLFIVIGLILPDLIILHFSLDKDFLNVANAIGIFFMLLGCIFYGLLANYNNAGKVMMFGSLLLILQTFAFFYQLESGGDFILIMYALLGFCTGIIGIIPAIIVRIFPTDIRLTGLCLSYNIAYALVGSALPFALAYATEHVSFTPALYVTFIGLIGIIIGLYLARLPDFKDIPCLSTDLLD
ncbi:MFS transporter [Psychrobacter sp. I-STPA10]|uniref:MFS transporter n=1 Tax=Psychrobacter sp. I-STPA10 TaxID=2585769 RepID=UPI001E2F8370|nr:MFS transporter [Psychrobacter sp. I-STPA10]